MRRHAVLRFCLQLLTAVFQGGLIAWAGCAPIVWILRDGLGPNTQESGWGLGLLKFAVVWGVPAIVLAIPSYGLILLERRMAAGKRTQPLAPR